MKQYHIARDLKSLRVCQILEFYQRWLFHYHSNMFSADGDNKIAKCVPAGVSSF